MIKRLSFRYLAVLKCQTCPATVLENKISVAESDKTALKQLFVKR